jgi:hypothetical protein
MHNFSPISKGNNDGAPTLQHPDKQDIGALNL